MLNKIFKIFSKPEPMLSNESRNFITKLASDDIWILAVGLRGTPTIPNITDPTAFDIIAAHRTDVSKVGNNDSVFPFNYEYNEKQVLPFFSSAEHAHQFSTTTNFPTDITIFQPCNLMAGFLSAPENDIFELILNARLPTEHTLARDERLFLRSISTPDS